ncbi:uncharacterized protein PFL1_04214 [Pseudozyma flocculosa PF-1]|uniref:Anaphase-promoting complex subunit 4 WD40 domain-containing protein n=1 Tax=Pseudozyma flocculosa PF-1 TaxID=1277687 RepID=A0A061H626_9BASI|nr:uncharacterized protein PFL1_04214 [Pseudozyma flocculosa PF-1]EPQ28387.1 hypothetical protein PFL1_04214 [Pseudozyma flocculosa PF-1]
MSLQYLADLETTPDASHSTPVLSVCWTQRAILSADLSGALKAWDPTTLLAACTLPQPHSNSVHALSTDRDTRYVLSSSIDGSVALWDTGLLPRTASAEAGTEEGDAAPQGDETIGDQVEHDAASSRQGPLVAAAPEEVVVCRTDTIASSSDGVSEAWSTALHPTLPVFASVGIGARPSLHSASRDDFGSLVAISPPHTAAAAAPDSSSLFGTKLALHAEGSLLAVGTSTGQVFLYALGQGEDGEGWSLDLLTTYADHALPVRALHFDAKDHLVVGCDDLVVTLHDVRAQRRGGGDAPSATRLGGTVAALQGHRGWIMDVKSCPTAQGRIVATSSTDRTIKLWDLAVTPKSCVCTCTELDEVWCIDWRPTPPLRGGQEERGGDRSVWTATTASTSTGGLGQGSKFVTGGHDGRVRMYRSAGV